LSGIQIGCQIEYFAKSLDSESVLGGLNLLCTD
jgi:hypothetical protein